MDGERSSVKTKHPFLGDPAVRQALNLLVDRGAVQEQIYGRTGIATANFLNAPERVRSKNMKWEFNIDKANQILDAAGWKRGSDGIRAKDGVKLKGLFQTSINAPRQKTQQIVKQAAAKAGIEMELKSVAAAQFFSSDVANPDTYSHFYTDIQMYTTTMTQPDAELFMLQFTSLGSRVEGQQVAGAKHHALAERGVRQALPRGGRRDGSRQARGALHQDERPRDPEHRGDPRRAAPSASRPSATGCGSSGAGGTPTSGRCTNWYREG